MDIVVQLLSTVFSPVVGKAFFVIFQYEVLFVMVAAGAFGLFVGATPGLTATMATALLIPVTFFMDPVPAIAAIVACEAMAIFAGDIPGALIRIPGTPASAAYVDEAHAMTRKGLAETALGTNLVCSVLGGLFGTVVLVSMAPSLAEFALNFSSFEYFWLACLGLSCAAMLATDAPLKGLVSLFLGLFISTMGLGIIAGFPRFTFGVNELLGGVDFIAAMIGMFAISEILRYAAATMAAPRPPQQRIGSLFKGLGRILYKYKVNLLRSSMMGTVIGILPGAGGDIAAWVTFATSRKLSKEPEKWGTGHVEGLVDASASNNAALGGAWVPALVFGIPGDSVTAIAIGVLYMKGLTPGPTIFLHQPEQIYGVFIAFFLANLLLLPLGFAAIRASSQILRVPRHILMPVILVFCVVGAFAINNTVFGVTVMLVLGAIAYVMEENGYPIAPAILGIVLGPLLEDNFITSMIKADGHLLGFFERPISAALGVVTLIVWMIPLVLFVRSRSRPAAA